MRDEEGERKNIRCLCVCVCDSKSGVCVLFQMSGCITAQRDSDVPLTFAVGSDGGNGGRRMGDEREKGMPQNDTCRTI